MVPSGSRVAYPARPPRTTGDAATLPLRYAGTIPPATASALPFTVTGQPHAATSSSHPQGERIATMDPWIVTGATLLAMVGLLFFTRRTWFTPPPPRHRWNAAIATVLLGGFMFGTGWLLRPALPPPPWTAAWLPAAPDGVRYDGQLLSGGIGPLRLATGPVREGIAAARLLGRGAGLGVVLIAGSAPRDVAPLIAVYDAAGTEVAALAVHRDDLILRMRTRADAAGLPAPPVRLPRGLRHLQPGDTIRLAAGLDRLGRCFDVGTHRTCGVGFNAGSGWNFIADPPGLDARTRALLDGAWLAVLALPIGFFAAPRIAIALFTALAWFAVIRLPVDTALLPLPPFTTLLLATGIAAGLVIGGRVRLRRAQPTPATNDGAAEHSTTPP